MPVMLRLHSRHAVIPLVCVTRWALYLTRCGQLQWVIAKRLDTRKRVVNTKHSCSNSALCSAIHTGLYKDTSE